MKTIARILSTAIVLSFSAQQALAAGYMGVGLGQTALDEDGFEDTSGFKVNFGTMLNDNIGVSMGYTNLGTFDVDKKTLALMSSFFGVTVTSASAEMTGLEFAATGVLPLSERLSMLGQLGVYLWDVEFESTVVGAGTGKSSEDGNDISTGIGARYNFSEKVGLQLEYTKYEVLDSNVDYLGASLIFSF